MFRSHPPTIQSLTHQCSHTLDHKILCDMKAQKTPLAGGASLYWCQRAEMPQALQRKAAVKIIKESYYRCTGIRSIVAYR